MKGTTTRQRMVDITCRYQITKSEFDSATKFLLRFESVFVTPEHAELLKRFINWRIYFLNQMTECNFQELLRLLGVIYTGNISFWLENLNYQHHQMCKQSSSSYYVPSCHFRALFDNVDSFFTEIDSALRTGRI